MKITPASLNAIYVNFSLRFQSSYTATKPWYERIASEVPSGTETETYAFMGKIPKLRKWVGDRVLNNVAARAYSLKNDKYEDTVTVPRTKIEDDQLGTFGPLIDMMGQQTRKWPDDLVAAALQAGTSAVCYDGQPFFNASHPVDIDDATKGTQSNNYTGTQLNAANYSTVRAAQMSLKGEDGHPLGITPNLIIVPPALERTARTIVNADMIPSDAGTAPQTNVLKGTADVLVIPELAGQDTTWYLADTTKPLQPMIFQMRDGPEFVELTSPNSEPVFKRDEFVYGVRTRGAAGYGLWQLMARAIA